MVTWNLATIIAKVRNITGTPATTQLSDSAITDYINSYYSFTMPFELKEQVNLQPLNFSTIANQDVYSFPSSTFLTDQPMAYANGFPLIFYQDRDIFFQDWPQQYTQDSVGTADGSTANFPGTTMAYPVIAGTFSITDGSQICTDVPNDPWDGSGTLVGDINIAGTNTINYVTGAFDVTFSSIPDSGLLIYDNYQAYQPARPQGVLFYNNEFTFRPVPDQVYSITMQGFVVQTQLTNSSDAPTFTEWGLLIAYGAALEIFADRGDLVAYNNTFPILKRYENVALARFVQQFDNVQSVPRF